MKIQCPNCESVIYTIVDSDILEEDCPVDHEVECLKCSEVIELEVTMTGHYSNKQDISLMPSMNNCTGRNLGPCEHTWVEVKGARDHRGVLVRCSRIGCGAEKYL